MEWVKDWSVCLWQLCLATSRHPCRPIFQDHLTQFPCVSNGAGWRIVGVRMSRQHIHTRSWHNDTWSPSRWVHRSNWATCRAPGGDDRRACHPAAVQHIWHCRLALVPCSMSHPWAAQRRSCYRILANRKKRFACVPNGGLMGQGQGNHSCEDRAQVPWNFKSKYERQGTS